MHPGLRFVHIILLFVVSLFFTGSLVSAADPAVIDLWPGKMPGDVGIILKYRCPRRPGDLKGEHPRGPVALGPSSGTLSGATGLRRESASVPLNRRLRSPGAAGRRDDAWQREAVQIRTRP